MYKLTSGVGLSGILLLICFLTPESVVGKGTVCKTHTDCSHDYESCLFGGCEDLRSLCQVVSYCGVNATCIVRNHEAVCVCKPGATPTRNFPCKLEADLTLSEVEGHNSPKNKTFYYVSEPMNWVAANTYCNNNGSGLATIKSQSENQMVLALLPRPESEMHVWLGGICPVKGEPCFWINPWSQISGYNQFHREEPNQYGGRESCLTFNTYYDSIWTWGDGQCPHAIPFVCETYQ